MRSSSPAAPSIRAISQFPGVSLRESTTPWNSCRSRTSAATATRSIPRSTSSRPASASSSSAADTGADCLGTVHRQKPISVHQFEIMPKPPDERSPQTPWPLWPMQLRVEGAHEEGGIRDWSIATTKLTGENGSVQQLHAVRVGPAPKFEPIAGSEFTMDADLILIAMGFLGPVRNGMIEQLGVQLDNRGNVATDQNYMSSVPGVFAAGDMRRGQSLVVWAISEGRKAAACVDTYLKSLAVRPVASSISSARPIAS